MTTPSDADLATSPRGDTETAATPGRILVVRIGALGDAIHTLPLVSEIRRRWPDAIIDWAAGPGVIRLLDGHPAVRAFIKVERSFDGLRRARATVKNAYDVAIDTQGLMKSAWLASGAAPRVIGRARGHAREFPATWGYTDHVAPSGSHIIEQNLELLRPLVPDYVLPREIRYDLPMEPAPAWSLSHQRPVLFNIGGGWWTKLWPTERWSQLARAIDETLGVPIGVVWGPSEEETARAIAAASPAIMAPPTTMRQLAGLFAEARLVISGETGPLHLAVAAGCRTVAILGPTAAARNGPYGPGHSAVEADVSCRPCHARSCADWRCLPGVSVDRVFRAVAETLG